MEKGPSLGCGGKAGAFGGRCTLGGYEVIQAQERNRGYCPKVHCPEVLRRPRSGSKPTFARPGFRKLTRRRNEPEHGGGSRSFRKNFECQFHRSLPGCYRGPRRAPASMRPVQILMCAHRKSRHLGVRFADNEPDVARHATSDDDAVLISGEPEARDIGARDRIAGDFLISHPHDWSRRVYWNSTTKAPIRMARMAIHMSESQMNKMLRVIAAVKP
jgi:hypothetical protein